MTQFFKNITGFINQIVDGVKTMWESITTGSQMVTETFNGVSSFVSRLPFIGPILVAVLVLILAFIIVDVLRDVF